MDGELTRFQGSMLVLAVGALLSLEPLIFRALLEAGDWQYLFYRSLSAVVVATLTIVVFGRKAGKTAGEWITGGAKDGKLKKAFDGKVKAKRLASALKSIAPNRRLPK